MALCIGVCKTQQKPCTIGCSFLYLLTSLWPNIKKILIALVLHLSTVLLILLRHLSQIPTLVAAASVVLSFLSTHTHISPPLFGLCQSGIIKILGLRAEERDEWVDGAESRRVCHPSIRPRVPVIGAMRASWRSERRGGRRL